jgi:hypothetical protein
VAIGLGDIENWLEAYAVNRGDLRRKSLGLMESLVGRPALELCVLPWEEESYLLHEDRTRFSINDQFEQLFARIGPAAATSVGQRSIACGTAVTNATEDPEVREKDLNLLQQLPVNGGQAY